MDPQNNNKKENKRSSRCQVHIRLKECSDDKKAVFNIFTGGTQLHIPASGGKNEQDKWYGFDHVYRTTACNKDVYTLSGYSLVESALKGYNTAIFAYGQQGSGKTRTLMSRDGVAAHMVSHLFNRLSVESTEYQRSVSVSYFHIYNEHIYDLLNPYNDVACTIREDRSRGTYVENVTRVLCENPMDVYDMINVGRKSLIVAETKTNRHSSRSHAVLQLSIEYNAKRKKRFSGKGRCSSLADMVEETEFESDIFGEPDFFDSPRYMSDRRRQSSGALEEAQDSYSELKELKKSSSLREDSLTAYTNRSEFGGDVFYHPTYHKNNNKTLSRSHTSDQGRHTDVRHMNDNHHSHVRTLGEGADNSLSHSQSSINTSQCSDSAYYDNTSDTDCSSCGSSSLFSSDDTGKPKGSLKPFAKNSRISIIDLAGSERIKLSQSDRNTDRLREAQNINLSLHELGNVISALASSKRRHIPYRNSVLTRLLQGGLGRKCRITFLLCISTKMVDINETKRTLEFGQKLKPIKPIKILEDVYKRKYEDLTSYWKDIEKNKAILPKNKKRNSDSQQLQRRTAGEILKRSHSVQTPNRYAHNDSDSEMDLTQSCGDDSISMADDEDFQQVRSAANKTSALNSNKERTMVKGSATTDDLDTLTKLKSKAKSAEELTESPTRNPSNIVSKVRLVKYNNFDFQVLEIPDIDMEHMTASVDSNGVEQNNGVRIVSGTSEVGMAAADVPTYVMVPGEKLGSQEPENEYCFHITADEGGGGGNEKSIKTHSRHSSSASSIACVRAMDENVTFDNEKETESSKAYSTDVEKASSSSQAVDHLIRRKSPAGMLPDVVTDSNYTRNPERDKSNMELSLDEHSDDSHDGRSHKKYRSSDRSICTDRFSAMEPSLKPKRSTSTLGDASPIQSDSSDSDQYNSNKVREKNTFDEGYETRYSNDYSDYYTSEASTFELSTESDTQRTPTKKVMNPDAPKPFSLINEVDSLIGKVVDKMSSVIGVSATCEPEKTPVKNSSNLDGLDGHNNKCEGDAKNDLPSPYTADYLPKHILTSDFNLDSSIQNETHSITTTSEHRTYTDIYSLYPDKSTTEHLFSNGKSLTDATKSPTRAKDQICEITLTNDAIIQQSDSPNTQFGKLSSSIDDYFKSKLENKYEDLDDDGSPKSLYEKQYGNTISDKSPKPLHEKQYDNADNDESLKPLYERYSGNTSSDESYKPSYEKRSRNTSSDESPKPLYERQYGNTSSDESPKPLHERQYSNGKSDESPKPLYERQYGNMSSDEPSEPLHEKRSRNTSSDESPKPVYERQYGNTSSDEPSKPCYEKRSRNTSSDDSPKPLYERQIGNTSNDEHSKPLYEKRSRNTSSEESPKPMYEENYGNTSSDEPSKLFHEKRSRNTSSDKSPKALYERQFGNTSNDEPSEQSYEKRSRNTSSDESPKALYERQFGNTSNDEPFQQSYEKRSRNTSSDESPKPIYERQYGNASSDDSPKSLYEKQYGSISNDESSRFTSEKKHTNTNAEDSLKSTYEASIKPIYERLYGNKKIDDIFKDSVASKDGDTTRDALVTTSKDTNSRHADSPGLAKKYSEGIDIDDLVRRYMASSPDQGQPSIDIMNLSEDSEETMFTKLEDYCLKEEESEIINNKENKLEKCGIGTEFKKGTIAKLENSAGKSEEATVAYSWEDTKKGAGIIIEKEKNSKIESRDNTQKDARAEIEMVKNINLENSNDTKNDATTEIQMGNKINLKGRNDILEVATTEIEMGNKINLEGGNDTQSVAKADIEMDNNINLKSWSDTQEIPTMEIAMDSKINLEGRNDTQNDATKDIEMVNKINHKGRNCTQNDATTEMEMDNKINLKGRNDTLEVATTEIEMGNQINLEGRNDTQSVATTDIEMDNNINLKGRNDAQNDATTEMEMDNKIILKGRNDTQEVVTREIEMDSKINFEDRNDTQNDVTIDIEMDNKINLEGRNDIKNDTTTEIKMGNKFNLKGRNDTQEVATTEVEMENQINLEVRTDTQNDATTEIEMDNKINLEGRNDTQETVKTEIEMENKISFESRNDTQNEVTKEIEIDSKINLASKNHREEFATAVIEKDRSIKLEVSDDKNEENIVASKKGSELQNCHCIGTEEIELATGTHTATHDDDINTVSEDDSIKIENKVIQISETHTNKETTTRSKSEDHIITKVDDTSKNGSNVVVQEENNITKVEDLRERKEDIHSEPTASKLEINCIIGRKTLQGETENGILKDNDTIDTAHGSNIKGEKTDKTTCINVDDHIINKSSDGGMKSEDTSLVIESNNIVKTEDRILVKSVNHRIIEETSTLFNNDVHVTDGRTDSLLEQETVINEDTNKSKEDEDRGNEISTISERHINNETNNDIIGPDNNTANDKARGVSDKSSSSSNEHQATSKFDVDQILNDVAGKLSKHLSERTTADDDNDLLCGNSYTKKKSSKYTDSPKSSDMDSVPSSPKRDTTHPTNDIGKSSLDNQEEHSERHQSDFTSLTPALSNCDAVTPLNTTTNSIDIGYTLINDIDATMHSPPPGNELLRSPVKPLSELRLCENESNAPTSLYANDNQSTGRADERKKQYDGIKPTLRDWKKDGNEAEFDKGKDLENKYLIGENYTETTVEKTDIANKRLPNRLSKEITSKFSGESPDSVGSKSPIDLIRSKSPIDTVRSRSPISTIGSKSPIDIIRSKSPIDIVRNKSPIDIVRSQSPIGITRSRSPSLTSESIDEHNKLKRYSLPVDASKIPLSTSGNGIQRSRSVKDYINEINNRCNRVTQENPDTPLKPPLRIPRSPARIHCSPAKAVRSPAKANRTPTKIPRTPTKKPRKPFSKQKDIKNEDSAKSTDNAHLKDSKRRVLRDSSEEPFSDILDESILKDIDLKDIDAICDEIDETILKKLDKSNRGSKILNDSENVEGSNEHTTYAEGTHTEETDDVNDICNITETYEKHGANSEGRDKVDIILNVDEAPQNEHKENTLFNGNDSVILKEDKTANQNTEQIIRNTEEGFSLEKNCAPADLKGTNQSTLDDIGAPIDTDKCYLSNAHEPIVNASAKTILNDIEKVNANTAVETALKQTDVDVFSNTYKTSLDKTTKSTVEEGLSASTNETTFNCIDKEIDDTAVRYGQDEQESGKKGLLDFTLAAKDSESQPPTIDGEQQETDRFEFLDPDESIKATRMKEDDLIDKKLDIKGESTTEPSATYSEKGGSTSNTVDSSCIGNDSTTPLSFPKGPVMVVETAIPDCDSGNSVPTPASVSDLKTAIRFTYDICDSNIPSIGVINGDRMIAASSDKKLDECNSVEEDGAEHPSESKEESFTETPNDNNDLSERAAQVDNDISKDLSESTNDPQENAIPCIREQSLATDSTIDQILIEVASKLSKHLSEKPNAIENGSHSTTFENVDKGMNRENIPEDAEKCSQGKDDVSTSQEDVAFSADETGGEQDEPAFATIGQTKSPAECFIAVYSGVATATATDIETDTDVETECRGTDELTAVVVKDRTIDIRQLSMESGINESAPVEPKDTTIDNDGSMIDVSFLGIEPTFVRKTDEKVDENIGAYAVDLESNPCTSLSDKTIMDSESVCAVNVSNICAQTLDDSFDESTQEDLSFHTADEMLTESLDMVSDDDTVISQLDTTNTTDTSEESTDTILHAINEIGLRCVQDNAIPNADIIETLKEKDSGTDGDSSNEDSIEEIISASCRDEQLYDKLSKEYGDTPMIYTINLQDDHLYNDHNDNVNYLLNDFLEFADEMQNGGHHDEDTDSFASERFAPQFTSHRLASLERELEQDWDAPTTESPIKSTYLPFEMNEKCYNVASTHSSPGRDERMHGSSIRDEMLDAIDKAIDRSVNPDLSVHHAMASDEESTHVDDRPFDLISDIVSKISELPTKYRHFDSSTSSLKKLSTSTLGSGGESLERSDRSRSGRSNATSSADERDDNEDEDEDDDPVEYMTDVDGSNGGAQTYLVNKRTYDLVNAVDGLLQQLSIPYDTSYEDDKDTKEMERKISCCDSATERVSCSTSDHVTSDSDVEKASDSDDAGGIDEKRGKEQKDGSVNMGSYKARFDDLLKQMRSIERSHELELDEYYRLLEAYDEEKQKTVCPQQELMGSLQMEFDNLHNEFNQSKQKVAKLQDKLSEKERLLRLIDDELSHLKSEFDMLIRSLGKANGNGQCACRLPEIMHQYLAGRNIGRRSKIKSISESILSPIYSSSEKEDEKDESLKESSCSPGGYVSDDVRSPGISTDTEDSCVQSEIDFDPKTGLIEETKNDKNDICIESACTDTVDVTFLHAERVSVDHIPESSIDDSITESACDTIKDYTCISNDDHNEINDTIQDPVVDKGVDDTAVDTVPNNVENKCTKVSRRNISDASTNTDMEMTTDLDAEDSLPNPRTPIQIHFLKSPDKQMDSCDECEIRRCDAATLTTSCDVLPSSNTDLTLMTRSLQTCDELETFRSAILTELMGLRNLCNCGELRCNDAINSDSLVHSRKDLCSAFVGADGEMINDGINGLFSDMMDASSYIFSTSATSGDSQFRSQSSCSYVVHASQTASVTRSQRSSYCGTDITGKDDQLGYLKDYLRQRKKSIDRQLWNTAQDLLSYSADERQQKTEIEGDKTGEAFDVESVSQHELFEQLFKHISEQDTIALQDLDKYRAMLNIVRSDHTITVFLQTLVNRGTTRPASVISLSYRPESIVQPVCDNKGTLNCGDTEEYTNGIYIGPQKVASTCVAMDTANPGSGGSSSPESGISSLSDIKKQLITSESDSDSEQLNRKRTIFSRFLCMPLKSRKSKKRGKRKTSSSKRKTYL